jgi:hypothetical protein
LKSAYRAPLVVAVAGLAAVSVLGSTVDGRSALFGVVDGAVLSVIGLASLRALSNLLRTTQPRPRIGVSITILVAVLKLPIILLGVWIATELSSPGLYCFLASVGLVYSAFVWGVARDVQLS